MVAFGAIRHDGCWEHPEAKYHAIAAEKWNYRKPFFSGVDADGNYQALENTQEVMDAQINLAADAGLDFWTFFWYQRNETLDGYNYGIQLFLQSEFKRRMKFALMLPSGHILEHLFAEPYLRKIYELVQDEQYLTDEYNRPVIYIYKPELLVETYGARSVSVIGAIKDTVKVATGRYPYLVAMTGNPERDKAMIITHGYDAVTAYTAHNSNLSGGNQPYENLEISNENFWNRLLSTGKQVIPIVNTGWDGRPNAEYFGKEYYNDLWYQDAPAWKIERNVKNALDWMEDHPGMTQQKTVLLYAWNEYSEGGWINPTDTNYRLNRLASNVFGGRAMSVSKFSMVKDDEVLG